MTTTPATTPTTTATTTPGTTTTQAPNWEEICALPENDLAANLNFVPGAWGVSKVRNSLQNSQKPVFRFCTPAKGRLSFESMWSVELTPLHTRDLLSLQESTVVLIS